MNVYKVSVNRHGCALDLQVLMVLKSEVCHPKIKTVALQTSSLDAVLKTEQQNSRFPRQTALYCFDTKLQNHQKLS